MIGSLFMLLAVCFQLNVISYRTELLSSFKIKIFFYHIR